MPGSLVARTLALGIAVAGVALPAVAQDDDREPSTGYTAILDNIDLLVDNYARFLARKYDLTEEQDEYTKSLLRERSYDFLDKYEGELRNSIDRLFDVRTGGEMTPEELIEWGRRVQPIYDEAKKLIVDGNDEWREILTPAQQKIHDQDLKLMYQSFETTEDQLGRILSGEMTVEEFRSPQKGRRTSSKRTPSRPPPDEPRRIEQEPLEPPPPPPPPPPEDDPEPRISPRDQSSAVREAGRAGGNVVQRPGERPPTRTSERRSQPERKRADPRDARRDRARPTRPTGKSGGQEFESQWEKYVREFIEKYELNDEQSQKAYAVLEDCETQANRYVQGRQSQIEQYDKQIEGLKSSDDKEKSKKIAELTEKRKQLMDPIDRVFEKQLKPRLEKLPTRAQRRAAEEAAKKKPGSKASPERTKDESPPSGEGD